MTLEERFQEAIKKIGTLNLLNLPEDVKAILKETNSFETKVKMLEMIAGQVN